MLIVTGGNPWPHAVTALDTCVLINGFIIYLYRSSEILANCLTSFQELMDHGDVSWDFLTHGFIKHVMFLHCISRD